MKLSTACVTGKNGSIGTTASSLHFQQHPKWDELTFHGSKKPIMGKGLIKKVQNIIIFGVTNKEELFPLGVVSDASQNPIKNSYVDLFSTNEGSIQFHGNYNLALIKADEGLEKALVDRFNKKTFSGEIIDLKKLREMIVFVQFQDDNDLYPFFRVSESTVGQSPAFPITVPAGGVAADNDFIRGLLTTWKADKNPPMSFNAPEELSGVNIKEAQCKNVRLTDEDLIVDLVGFLTGFHFQRGKSFGENESLVIVNGKKRNVKELFDFCFGRGLNSDFACGLARNKKLVRNYNKKESEEPPQEGELDLLFNRALDFPFNEDLIKEIEKNTNLHIPGAIGAIQSVGFLKALGENPEFINGLSKKSLEKFIELLYIEDRDIGADDNSNCSWAEEHTLRFHSHDTNVPKLLASLKKAHEWPVHGIINGLITNPELRRTLTRHGLLEDFIAQAKKLRGQNADSLLQFIGINFPEINQEASKKPDEHRSRGCIRSPWDVGEGADNFWGPQVDGDANGWHWGDITEFHTTIDTAIAGGDAITAAQKEAAKQRKLDEVLGALKTKKTIIRPTINALPQDKASLRRIIEACKEEVTNIELANNLGAFIADTEDKVLDQEDKNALTAWIEDNATHPFSVGYTNHKRVPPATTSIDATPPSPPPNGDHKVRRPVKTTKLAAVVKSHRARRFVSCTKTTTTPATLRSAKASGNGSLRQPQPHRTLTPTAAIVFSVTDNTETVTIEQNKKFSTDDAQYQLLKRLADSEAIVRVTQRDQPSTGKIIGLKIDANCNLTFRTEAVAGINSSYGNITIEYNDVSAETSAPLSEPTLV